MVLNYILIKKALSRPEDSTTGPAKKKWSKLLNRVNARESYLIAAYSIILILIAFPAIISFKIISQQGRLRYDKFAQVKLARSFVDWKRWHEKNYIIPSGFIYNRSEYESEAMEYGFYSQIKGECDVDFQEDNSPVDLIPNSMCEAFCRILPPLISTDEKIFLIDLGAKQNYSWNYPGGDKNKILLKYTDAIDVMEGKPGQLNPFYIESNLSRIEWKTANIPTLAKPLQNPPWLATGMNACLSEGVDKGDRKVPLILIGPCEWM